MKNTDTVDLNELLQPTEMTLIDMLPYVVEWDDDPYLNALVAPPVGIYLPGSVEPVLHSNGKYYPQSKLGEEAHLITDLTQIYNVTEPIVDKNGIVLTTPDKLRRLKRYITTQPQVPAMAIKVACSIAIAFINNLSIYTRSPRNTYHLSRLVSDQHFDLIATEAYENLLDEMLLSLNAFVGKDRHHIYFTRLKGTSLVVEKTIDFRVYDWYRMQQSKDHD